MGCVRACKSSMGARAKETVDKWGGVVQMEIYLFLAEEI